MNVFKEKTWSLLSIFALVVNLLLAYAPPAHASTKAKPALSPLPVWFTAAAPATTPRAAPTSDFLPGWFIGHNHSLAGTVLSPPARPSRRDIPLSLLTVDVIGPDVASLGSPPGYGEVYTAVIRNNSTNIAYGLYLTTTHQPYFIHDGGDQLISTTGSIPFTVVTATSAITWTPVTTYNLAPGEVITLNFKLRATCSAESGQQMRVGVRYNADPPPEPPGELNDGGLNITTGRGNLVIKKEPAIQNLGTPDFGQPITWIVTVQNTGLGKLYNAVITDTGGISLSQPSGDLKPSATITELGVNEVQTFTVVGTVEACNFTNVALGSWPCGNLVGDATVTNPLSSTVSVLFTPQVPDIGVQVSSPITFSYCEAITRTVVVTINNAGGPGGDFRLDSGFESDGFLEMITSSLGSDWAYNASTGVFIYAAGSPTGTIPNASVLTFTFQVRPQSDYVCAANGGQILFDPHYNDVCTHNPFTADPVILNYEGAQGAAPTLGISKDGPGVVASGEVFTYQITVWGTNPANISGTVGITDLLPSQFALLNYTSVSTGTVVTTAQGLDWRFDPPDTPSTFSETLTYRAQVAVSDTICGASLIVQNDVQATANPTCPGCSSIVATTQVDTAIENNEGIFPGNSAAGSFEACGVGGFTITNRYQVTGTTVITWAGTVFTEALGTPIGAMALPGPTYLTYVSGSLSVTVDGTDYTGLLTPTTTVSGQLVIDLSPLQAAGAPTQNLTLFITYTVEIPEDALNGAVERTFYDWSQLFLPNFSEVEGCAANHAFNQVLRLTIGRGDLSVELSPPILDKCSTNPVVIRVNDNAPDRLTDHVVITFTSSSAEIRSARNFTYTGSLAAVPGPITVITDSDVGGGLGIITFTLPVTADLDGDGEIRFEVDINCTDESPWDAGITFQSRCAVTYDDGAHLDHAYCAPNLILFATPIEYTVREKEVIWKFFLTNNGNLTATNVVVTNVLQGLAVITYTPDNDAGISVSGTLPITYPTPVRFTIDTLSPNQQRAVTVTARVVACDPLHVDVIAEHGCFGTVCSRPQAEVNFNTPDPYLLTNNGETADLPMCDPGEVIFTTKNASSDVTLYQLNITETLVGLAPIPGAPMTMTIVDENENTIASTTAFTPVTIVSGTQTMLLWKAISATTDVVTWFNALPPLYVVRVVVPVQTHCVPPNTPRSFAAASALGPCDNQLGYTEDAVTLQTLQPDMTVLKEGKVVGGQFGDIVYATPGQTVTWRIEVDNRNSGRSYVAHNVVLSDTWPPNFGFITATLGFSPTIVTAQRTITWDIGDLAPLGAPLEFFITGTVVLTDDACGASTVNATRLTFGCDFDGCTSALVPQDTAQLGTQPDPAVTLSPGPLQTCAGDIPVTISNDGAAAYSATLTVTLPSGYVYSHTVSSGLTPTEIISTPGSAPRFLWDMVPGRTGSNPYTFTMVLRVKNSAITGTCPVDDGRPVTATLGFDNHPICAEPVTSPVESSVSLQVFEPNLNVTKSPQTQIADVGQPITWTITVVNSGSGIAENVRITDVVGSSYANVTATASANVSGNVVTWALTAPLAASGGSWTAQVMAVLSDTGHNRNVVTATAGCATGCETAIVTDTAHATLLQEFEKNPAVQTNTIGGLAVFTFTAFLPDIDALYKDLSLTDTLPVGLGYVSSVLTYTYDGDGVGTAVVSYTPTFTPGWFASGDVIWALGDLSGTVQIDGVITTTLQDTTTNQAGVRLTNDVAMTYTDDDQPYVYTDTAEVDLLEPNQLMVKSSAPPTSSTVGAGDLVTYTVRVTNTAGITVSPAYDIFITDTLPAHVTLFAPIPISVAINGTSLSEPPDYVSNYGGGVLTLDLADAISIPVGGVLTLVYHGRVEADVPGGEDQINTVQVAWSSLSGAVPGDRDYAPLSATANVHAGQPSLALSKAAARSTVEAGDPLTYTLRVTNTGIVSATGVVVTDAVPPYTAYQSCGPAPCGEAGGVVSWMLGTLDLNESRWMTMTVLVDSPLLTGTDIVNSAWITSAESVTDTDTVTTPVTSRHALTLTKSADLPVVQAGDLLTYSLAWAVGGNEPALDVTVSDTTPVNTTFWAADPPTPDNPGVGAAGPVVWSLGVISPPANGLLTLTVRVDSPLISGTLLYNAAVITDSQDITDTDDVTTPVRADHVIAIVKSAEPSPVGAGGLLTYTLAYIVTGIEPAPDLTISDTTPVSTTFWAADPPTPDNPGVGGTGPVTWSLGTVSPPANGLVTLTVRVDSPLISGTQIYNAAIITDSEFLTDTSDITTPVESAHTLTLTKSADLPVVGAGDWLTYTLAWAVGGNEIALDVTVRDTVPTSTTYQNCLGASCAESGGVVAWSLGDLYPPDAGVVTMVVLVNTPLYSGTLLYNAAVITDSEGITDTDDVTTPVRSDHALAIVKTASPSPVAAGDTLTYTLLWSVGGNEPAPDVTISDTVPASTTYQGCAGAPCGEGGGVVTWSLGTVNPVASGAVTMVVTVDAGLPGGAVITNAVTITDSTELTDTDEITTSVRRADVAVTKVVTPPLVVSGDVVTFTLVYTNHGLVPAENVTVVDVLPDGLTYAAAVPNPVAVSGQVITWNLGTLNAGATGVVSLRATVDPTTTTSARLTNTVQISTTTPETDTDNNDDDEPVDLEQNADVSVVKSAQPPAVVSGDTITYTLTYANAGPADAANVIVTDTLPAGLTFAGCGPSACGVTGQDFGEFSRTVITWSLGTVPAGATGDLTLYATVDVTGALSAAFANTVIITTTTDDRDTDNNDDDETTPLTQTVGLEIIKVVLPGIGVNGQTLTYSVQLINTGDVPLSPVRLEDRLPDGFMYDDHARIYPPAGGAPLEPDVVTEPTLVWNDVTSGSGLPAGESMTLTFQVTVSTGVTGTFINVVTGTGTTPSGTITDTDDTPVTIEDPAVDVLKRMSGHDQPAGIITFTIFVSNIGPSTLDVVPLWDAYDPYYLSFADATPYPEEDADDGLLTWHDLTGPPPYGFDRNLPPGEQFVITTVFAIIHDITTTVNSVTVTDAIDEYDNPANDDDDDEPIIDTPTAIELLYLRASGQESAVLVEWATLLEVDSYGFWLYRAVLDQFAQAVQLVFQASQGGGSGAAYTFLDKEVESGRRYWYWLVEVDNEGLETRYGPVSALAGIVDDLWYKLYLPLVIKNADGDSALGSQGLDSDGASIPDGVEGGDEPAGPVDDESGGAPDDQDLDSDDDGVPDSVERGNDSAEPVDGDGDGSADNQDPDSDGDSVPDSVEAGDEPTGPVDGDGDGTPDYRDVDSDGDGIPDSVEVGADPDKPMDTDGDGAPDYQDLDSDGDGIPDGVEAGLDPISPLDSDGDGTPDYRDLDSDGDGILDADEWSQGPDDPLVGCSADAPVCFEDDADGDSIPHYLDRDSDGDGVLDAEEGMQDSDQDDIPDWLDPHQP